VAGQGRRHRDVAAVTGATLLGVTWVLFTWSVLGNVARLVLFTLGLDNPRAIAFGVLGVAALLCLWGWYEAMRVPRVRRVEVVLDRLGAGFDGVTVALLTDTHYGPINRARWSARTIAATNALAPDIACHTGDIADGPVTRRREQAAPLGAVRAPLARVYVTGNHEYFSEAQGWLDYIDGIGWDALHNKHIVIERDGDTLVIAGVDDATAQGSGVAGHGSDLEGALSGADLALPVMLLAHQPKQVRCRQARPVPDVCQEVAGWQHCPRSEPHVLGEHGRMVVTAASQIGHQVRIGKGVRVDGL